MPNDTSYHHTSASAIANAAEMEGADESTNPDQTFVSKSDTFHMHTKSHTKAGPGTPTNKKITYQPAPDLTLDYTTAMAHPPLHLIFTDGSQLSDANTGAAIYMEDTDECIPVTANLN